MTNERQRDEFSSTDVPIHLIHSPSPFVNIDGRQHVTMKPVDYRIMRLAPYVPFVHWSLIQQYEMGPGRQDRLGNELTRLAHWLEE